VEGKNNQKVSLYITNGVNWNDSNKEIILRSCRIFNDKYFVKLSVFNQYAKYHKEDERRKMAIGSWQNFL
jgi:hypothetical protein